MKKIFLLALILIGFKSFSQTIVNRANATNTVQDGRGMWQYNAFLPRFADTTAANVQKGIDSSGAIIYTYDVGGLWYRFQYPKRWVQLSGSSGSLNIYNSDGTLTGTRTLTLAGYNLRLAGSSTSSAFLADGDFVLGGTSKIGSYGSNRVMEIQSNASAFFGMLGGVSGSDASTLYLSVSPSTSSTGLISGKRGSGVPYPFTINTGALQSERIRIDTSGDLTIEQNVYMRTVPAGGATDSLLVISGGRIKRIAQSSVADSVPTLQQVLTAGNTLTGISNSINVGTTSFDIWSSQGSFTSPRIGLTQSSAYLGYQSIGVLTKYLNVTSSAMTVVDDAASKGLVNSGDYEANFTARSLVTKQYVDGAYTAGYGLSLSSGVFRVDTSAIQKKMSAGTGISLSGNTIYNTATLQQVTNQGATTTNNVTLSGGLTINGSSSVINITGINAYSTGNFLPLVRNSSTGFVESVTANDVKTFLGLSSAITGTGASGQVAYFNGSNSLTSGSTFLWNGTSLSVGTTATNESLNLGAASLNPKIGFTAAAGTAIGLGGNYMGFADLDSTMIVRNDKGDKIALGFNGTPVLTLYNTNASVFGGSVTATSIIKTGGTSSQFLMADGSVSTQTTTSSTYTPTVTLNTNCTAVTAKQCQYLRVGSTVTVSGAIELTVTGAAYTECEITLPIASDFTLAENCVGTGWSAWSSFPSVMVYGTAANNRAVVSFNAAAGGIQVVYFHYTYRVQ